MWAPKTSLDPLEENSLASECVLDLKETDIELHQVTLRHLVHVAETRAYR
jgi:hypothetical protein